MTADYVPTPPYKPAPAPTLVTRCSVHPTYTGVRKPRVECPCCDTVRKRATKLGFIERWFGK